MSIFNKETRIYDNSDCMCREGSINSTMVRYLFINYKVLKLS